MEIDVQAYDRVARDIFAPVYPLIADQIIAKTGICRGTCLDIGCGGGYLGLALVRRTDLFVRLFDMSDEMLAIAAKNIVHQDLSDRVNTLKGDVSAIPLPDESVDLAVSRGSAFFWEDLEQAFGEIYRVLAPGGWAYIGGGFGSKKIKQEIEAKMKALNNGDNEFSKKVHSNLGPDARKQFEATLTAVGIDDFSIVQSDDIGLWFILRKP